MIIKQVNEEFSVKELALATYREIIRRLMRKFEAVKCDPKSRSMNRYVDALALVASKMGVIEEREVVEVFQKDVPYTIEQWLNEEPEATD